MEQQKQKVSGMFLRQSVREAQQLRYGAYSLNKHNRISYLCEKAEQNFDLYKADLLTVEDKNKEAFASYIEQFGGYQREELLDKLQKESAFDVREYLQNRPQSWWQKLWHKEPLKYLSSATMEKKIHQFQKLQMMLSKHGFHATSQINKIEQLGKEAGTYIEAYNEGAYCPKADDLPVFADYVKTMGIFYAESPAERALDKVNKEINANTLKRKTLQIVHVKPKRSWSQRLKYAAIGIVAVVGSVFGLKSGTGAESKTLSAQPQAKTVRTPQAPKFAMPKTIDYAWGQFKSTPIQAQNIDSVKNAETIAHQKEWDNFYNNRLVKFTSNKKATALSEQMAAQLNAGIAQLPQDISPTHYLYAQQIYKKYGFKKIADELGEVLISKQALSKAQQDKLYQLVRQAGPKGVGVQKMAQKYHYDNLQQLRKSRHR